jgi:hypothetical protein
MNINTIIRAKEETFRNKVFQEDDNSWGKYWMNLSGMSYTRLLFDI